MEINNWKEKLDQFIVDNEVPEGARIYCNSSDFDEITSELKKWDVDILGIGGTLKYKNRLIAPIEDMTPGEFEYVESVRAIEFGSVSKHAVIDFEYKTRTEEEYQLDWLVYKADQLTNSGQIWVGGDIVRANKFYKGYLINKDKFLPTSKARVAVSELISDFFTWSPKIHDLYLKLYNLSEIAKDINQSVLPVDDDFFDDVVKYMVYPLDTGVTSIEYRGIKFVKDNFESEKMENTEPFFDELVIGENPEVNEAYEWMMERIKSFDLTNDPIEAVYIPKADYDQYKKLVPRTILIDGNYLFYQDYYIYSSDKVPEHTFVLETTSGLYYIHDSLFRPNVKAALETLRSLPKGQTELVVDDCFEWFGYLSLVGDWRECEHTEVEYYSKGTGKSCINTQVIEWNGISVKYVNKYKPEEKMEEQARQVLNNPINFNALGIFFFAPREFEPKPMFGATPEQQLVTILNLFQQGILVEGFYKTIVVNNG